MTAQLSLDSWYAPAATGIQTWTDELDVLREAVSMLGLKEVCHALDVNRSMLCDALAERDRKRWAGEWTHVVIALLTRRGDDLAMDVLRALSRARLGISPLDIIDRVELTADEKVVAYERELRKQGDRGNEVIARVTGRARR